MIVFTHVQNFAASK